MREKWRWSRWKEVGGAEGRQVEEDQAGEERGERSEVEQGGAEWRGVREERV